MKHFHGGRQIMEKRQEERQIAEFDMRIYTSVKKGAYSVRVSDISSGGAFVRTRYMPSIGETITYELFDETLRPIHSGNAKVCRITEDVPRDEKGFGILFYEKLDDSTMGNVHFNMN